MRKMLVLLLGVLVCLGLPTLGLADHKPGHQKGGGPPPSEETRVSVLFRDDVADKLRGDGRGAYVDGQQGVRAFLDAIGKLQLTASTDGSGAREITLDLSDEWTDGQKTCGTAAEPCVWKPAFFNASGIILDGLTTMVVVDICGADTGLDGGLRGMAVDETRCARLGLRFTDPAGGGFEWVDRFRPGIWPETNNVAVTRTNADTWVVTVDPEAGATSCPGFGDCTVLVRRKFSKGKPGTIIEGFFRVPFQFTITIIQ